MQKHWRKPSTMSKPATSNVYAVILVGGKGKRLRPLSTNARPKAFLSVTKDRKTMFRVTLDRIKKIVPKGNILVCANKAHAGLVKKDFPDIRKGNLILEPISRNTAPAIALAANLLTRQARDAVMVVLPADQYILDEDKYLDTIKAGVEFAADNNALMVLGLKPVYPATGFGYVKVNSKRKNILKVERFTEKPDLKTAKRFVKDGRYFWNAGAFVFKADAILSAIEKFAPAICNAKSYRLMPDISIDYAVMEKADNIYCVKGTYRWQDIGSFEALRKVLRRESRRFIEKNKKITKIL